MVNIYKLGAFHPSTPPLKEGVVDQYQERSSMALNQQNKI